MAGSMGGRLTGKLIKGVEGCEQSVIRSILMKLNINPVGWGLNISDVKDRFRPIERITSFHQFYVG